MWVSLVSLALHSTESPPENVRLLSESSFLGHARLESRRSIFPVLLNLEGMSDGVITVIDLANGERWWGVSTG